MVLFSVLGNCERDSSPRTLKNGSNESLICIGIN